MITPIIVWLAVAVIVVVVATSGIVRSIAHHRHAVHHPLFQMGKEREEVWIPGDPLRDADYDEFEDL